MVGKTSGFVVYKSDQALRGVEKAGHHGPCAQGADHPHNQPIAAVCLMTSPRSRWTVMHFMVDLPV